MFRKFTFNTQESFYLLTGIWPIIHIRGFIAVTGYKTDIWLVKMVAFLSVTIGIQLLKRRQSQIAQYNNSAFLFADRQLLSLHGTISEIYLIEAMVLGCIHCHRSAYGPKTVQRITNPVSDAVRICPMMNSRGKTASDLR